MRKISLVLLSLLLAAATADAAIQYEFRQVTRSDVEQLQRPDVTGRGIIDGARSRIDFHTGSVYGPGTYVITEDSGKSVTIVNNSDKTYSQHDVGAMVSAVGTQQIRIANLKTDFRKMEDKTIVAGLPTEHYRLTASYEVTVAFGELSIRQRVETIVDKWTTTAFGDVAESFFSSGLLKTGNAEIDRLIEAETRRFTGFPLRQVVSVTTRGDDVVQPRTKLPVPSLRRQISETVVTAIEAREVPPGQFAIPAGYKKVDRPTFVDKGAALGVTLQ
jgi:hypothetical protein